MGGRKIRNKMMLKPFIESDLRKLEQQLKNEYPEGFIGDYSQFDEMTRYRYIQGKIDALKRVLGKE